MGRAQGKKSYASANTSRRHGAGGVAVAAATAPSQDINFLQAQQTLQEITETAVGDRERRPLLAAELIVPSVHLAQQIAAQLHDYKLDGERIYVGDDDNKRCYRVREISWKTGSLGKRERHKAAVLTLETALLNTVLLWDPRTDSIDYDLSNPPEIPGNNFKELHTHVWSTVHCANATRLAQWAKDALPLLQQVQEREHARTTHLVDGLAASESTLDALAL
jgi:hypothetical protein